MPQGWKNFWYNTSFGLNCLLVFLLIFESRISLPAWLQVIGRMHPLFLHFPIVLMLICVWWELFARVKKSIAPEHNTIGDMLLLINSFTAVVTALMGLLLSKEAGYVPEELAWHKWSGVFISLLALLWYVFRYQFRNQKIILSLTGLSALAMVLVTGHLGGNITHGQDFLLAPVSQDKQAPAVLFEDVVIYTNMVQPILKAKCISCHNDSKAKGELVMETFAQLLKGGKTGKLWDNTKPDLGLLLSRIHLPADNKKHMPPTGKVQLTADEISILYHWIKMGANATAKAAALPPTDSLRLLAVAQFNTIETDNYSFKPADESKVKSLSNNYRFITPLAIGSPALGVEFFGAAQFKSGQLKELLPVKEQIVSLNLNKMPVTDDDLATIAQFVNLRRLNLSFTNIKGTGLAALKPLTELKQLSLSGTGVQAQNLSQLAALPKLTQLYIWSTPAQMQPLAALQKQLKNTVLQTGFNGDSIKMKLNAPIVENEEQIILHPITLKLKHYVKGVTIRYTTDGSEPDSLLSPLYNGNVVVNKNMTVKTKAFKQGWLSSEVSERVFYKAGFTIDSIRLVQAPLDLPYKIVPAKVLADAQKGDFNFRSGKWLGYKGIPMQAILYFDTARNISTVSISNLIDIGNYIMPPQQVEVWAGSDANHLRLIKKINPPQPIADASGGFMKGYDLSFEPVTAKCMKIVVVPVSKLPNWHRGKGENGWIFIDEIFLN
jgi:uncharacterized membrane protein